MRTRSVAGDLALTEIGLGAAQFGNLNRETTDEASTAAVDRAWEAGIRYFDTAPHYGLGLSERRLGAALAGRPRDEFVLSTKVGRLLVPDPHGASRTDDEGFVVPATTRRQWDFSRDGVLRSVEESLVRLGLDRIDVAYLHDPDDHWGAASTTGVGALIELRDQGVLRAVGAGMNQSAMLTELVRRCDVDVVMLAGRLTVLDQTALADLVPVVAERGVGIVAAGVYNSGILASPTVPDDAHFNYTQAPAELLARARAIAAVAGEFGVTVPELAVQYALAFDVVASVVLGTRTAAHVDAAVERYRATVPAELWTALVAQGLLPRVPGEH